MKQKLTITVDRELVPEAKRYARSRGVSLSSLIETELRGLVAEEGGSFASRWRGEFKPAAHHDPRYEALARKYL
jgi:post-segregation antitoxin (ccd killing protein)